MTHEKRAFSSSALDKLGKRLAKPSPEPGDIEMLRTVQPSWEAALTTALSVASDVVRGLPREPEEGPLDVAHRVKTDATLFDKLRRGTRLSRMQDVVGIRIVDPSGGLHQQNEIVQRLQERFVVVRVEDRRTKPSHGYRAVHLIPEIDGRAVEIQVRTGWQHAWANTMERCGDRWGRGIRYGEPPQGASAEEVADRSKQIGELMQLAHAIARWEVADAEYVELCWRRHAQAARGRSHLSDEELGQLLEEHRTADMATVRRAADELVAITRAAGPLMGDFRVQLERWPMRKDQQ